LARPFSVGQIGDDPIERYRHLNRELPHEPSYLSIRLYNDTVNYKPMATDQLSLVFAALADPTRRRMLARLAEGDATVKELAEPFSVSLPAISRHLKVLERAGLIDRRKSAQTRPRSIRVEAFKEADEWMKPYREIWQARITRLDAHLRERTDDD
jgi:DNA-binding transcriptional ArsR family regulator